MMKSSDVMRLADSNATAASWSSNRKSWADVPADPALSN